MDSDELIEKLLNEQSNDEPSEEDDRRARLIAIVSGGKGVQYLGSSSYTVDKIDKMTDEEVDKLYARYEARLGSMMTKTLGSSALMVFTSVVSRFLPIPPEKQSQLLHDLDEDPFVGHALNTTCCRLYHKYGMFLAPLTAAIITASYCRFKPKSQVNDIDGGDTGRRTTRYQEGPQESSSWQEGSRS